MPYDARALDRRGPELGRGASGARSAFAHDRDRIIYCTAFRRLAGKTQVVSAHEHGAYHTRLTHTLKVAQLGRRVAEKLRADYRRENGERGDAIDPPDPDLVEAACLAHDIGHPPFGHVGEEALCETFDELAGAGRKLGGFEGNAQSFRVATYLTGRLPLKPRCGLNLTRATLDAISKYPYLREDEKAKWGAYGADREALQWARDGQPMHSDADLSFEAAVMDWCDDVTYAVHDLIDFYVTRHIDLDRLLALRRVSVKGPQSLSPEALAFLESELPRIKPTYDIAHAKVVWKQLAGLSDIDQPWEQRAAVKATCYDVASRLITYFVEGVTWSAGDMPCRHDGRFMVDKDPEVDKTKRYACALLKQLVRARVIDQPALAQQQVGARRAVVCLMKACHEDRRLLPADRQEELDEHRDPVRAAADHVASLQEHDALALYKRVAGVDLGSHTDRLNY